MSLMHEMHLVQPASISYYHIQFCQECNVLLRSTFVLGDNLILFIVRDFTSR